MAKKQAKRTTAKRVRRESVGPALSGRLRTQPATKEESADQIKAAMEAAWKACAQGGGSAYAWQQVHPQTEVGDMPDYGYGKAIRNAATERGATNRACEKAAARRVPEAEQAIYGLDGAVKELGEVLDQLRVGLAYVLTPSSPPATGHDLRDTMPAPCRSPLADRLRGVQRDLGGLTGIVRDLLERLDLGSAG